jgi:hypothetical protein
MDSIPFYLISTYTQIIPLNTDFISKRYMLQSTMTISIEMFTVCKLQYKCVRRNNLYLYE